MENAGGSGDEAPTSRPGNIEGALAAKGDGQISQQRMAADWYDRMEGGSYIAKSMPLGGWAPHVLFFGAVHGAAV